MTSSSYTDTLDHFRQALTEIEQIITPGRTAQKYALYKQATNQYWTNLFSAIVPVQNSTGAYAWTVTARAVYRAGNITEAETSTEEHAQAVLFKAVYEFTRRPMLQSPAYTGGVYGIDPSGVRVISAEIVSGGTNEQPTLNVVVTLSIPLLFQTNQLDFS